MPYCTTCQTSLDAGDTQCPKCGTPVPGYQPPVYQAPPSGNYQQPVYQAPPARNQQQAYQAPPAGNYQQQAYQAPPAGSYQQAYTPQSDAAQNKWLGIVAYLWILFFIPLVAAPKSPFARFHANQGLILLICGVAASSLSRILSGLFGYFLSFGLIYWIFSIVSLGLVVLSILGIVNAANGKMEPVPVVGKLFTIIK